MLIENVTWGSFINYSDGELFSKLYCKKCDSFHSGNSSHYYWMDDTDAFECCDSKMSLMTGSDLLVFSCS